MYEIQLEHADVGALLRTVPEGTPWLLAIARIDWCGARPGDRVRLWYSGDPAANPAYSPGEWIARVREIRSVSRAPEITLEEVTAVLGFTPPVTDPAAFASQIWQGAANRRSIHEVLLVSFDFD